MTHPHTHLPPERITLRSIGEYILDSFNLQRGLGYTIKRLLIAPDAAIREFLFEDRRRMVKPLSFLLLSVGLATFVSFQFLPLREAFDNSAGQLQAGGNVPEWIRAEASSLVKFLQQYFNLTMMSTLPAMALGTMVLFTEQKLNYAEHLVVNAYIYSIQTLLIIPFMPLLPLTGFHPGIGVLLGVLVLAYLVYAFTRIFEQNWRSGIWKTVVTYLLAQVVYGTVMTLMFLIYAGLTGG